MRNIVAAAAGLAALLLSSGAMAGKDLDAIKARGALACGVGLGTASFMLADSQGKWKGLSVDVCRAVAAAIFGDAEKVIDATSADHTPGHLACCLLVRVRRDLFRGM